MLEFRHNYICTDQYYKKSVYYDDCFSSYIGAQKKLIQDIAEYGRLDHSVLNDHYTYVSTSIVNTETGEEIEEDWSKHPTIIRAVKDFDSSEIEEYERPYYNYGS